MSLDQADQAVTALLMEQFDTKVRGPGGCCVL
jgi:hypothetical protein